MPYRNACQSGRGGMMDLLDFEVSTLYFDYEDTPEVARLLQQAGDHYADGTAELPLLQAALRDPESFNVLVALNRFYYYQKRLEEALVVSERFLTLVCKQVDLPLDWQALSMADIEAVPKTELSWVRLYLFTLKSMGFLKMRLLQLTESQQIFEKLIAVDSEDRIGSKPLLSLVKTRLMQEQGLYPIHPMKMV